MQDHRTRDLTRFVGRLYQGCCCDLHRESYDWHKPERCWSIRRDDDNRWWRQKQRDHDPNANAQVSLSKLTVRNGSAEWGGGVYNNGILILALMSASRTDCDPAISGTSGEEQYGSEIFSTSRSTTWRISPGFVGLLGGAGPGSDRGCDPLRREFSASTGGQHC